MTLDHVTIAGHDCPFAAPAGAAIQVEDLSKLTVKDSIIWGNSREFQTLDKGSYTVENTVTSVPGKGNRSGRPDVRRSRQGRLPSPDWQQRDRGGFGQDQRWRLPQVTFECGVARWSVAPAGRTPSMIEDLASRNRKARGAIHRGSHELGACQTRILWAPRRGFEPRTLPVNDRPLYR